MSKSRNSVYVGGLDESVTEDILHAAFIPFGDLKSVQIVKNYQNSKLFKLPIKLLICVPDQSRGFGFVDFELDEDADAVLILKYSFFLFE